MAGAGKSDGESSIPHTRGDEPRKTLTGKNWDARIPHTRGDEPFCALLQRRQLGIPHTRGDEPFCALLQRRQLGIPHTRGDEPRCWVRSCKTLRVFPTHVGMNRGIYAKFL